MRFSEKRVLVAGGTGGLGRAVSLAFLQEGAQVSVTYFREDEFAALKSAAGPNGASLLGYRVDLTVEAAVTEFIDKLLAENKQLDALVNTVGGYAGGMKLWEGDSKVFDQMLALNVRAGLLLLRAVTPAMIRRGSGSIVNVASRAALVHDAGASAYAASKG
jgi:NAD(P)-dependent dehydrogenase (short-subunit alcohol dehydrogenase family)